MASMSSVGIMREIEGRYRRYLTTTFSFREPHLRASFEEALAGAGALSRGPFIEGRPAFRRTVALVDLCSELLGLAPDSGFLHALDGEGGRRVLFSHQEAAIREAFGGGNVLVATGTGSGKTEAFLYPILLSLYREFLEGRQPGPDSGVRALILYPMNALANDQKERLRTIAMRLKESGSPFSFTFGEYVGATPENRSQAEGDSVHAPEKAREYGELVYREDMRETPPDILLTNYSMLEYLLIRPKDSTLFDGGAARHWRFIVMDEAHQYTGIRGTEMGMLIRRLKQRLREGGREGDFTCVATSATIVGKDKNLQAVADFASVLFGEPFTSSQVILGEPVPVSGAASVELSAGDYERLRGAGEADLLEFATEKGLKLNPAGDARALLGSILLSDGRTLRLFDALRDPAPVTDLARSLFAELEDEKSAVEALEHQVNLLSQARGPSGEPLVTLRYHHFLRALEGAYISFYPELSVSLERGSRGEGARFELAICQECGQEYIVGQIRDGRLREAVRDPSSDEFGVSYFLPLGPPERGQSSPGEIVGGSAFGTERADWSDPGLSADRARGREQDENRDTDEDEDEAAALKPSHLLCAVCGRIVGASMPLDCGHDCFLGLSLQDSDKDSPDELQRCATCGRKGRDPAKEVIHGADGPHSVIATALHSMLEPERRKVLAFADGRQEAAFFAWYVEKSYEMLRNRSYLLEVIRRAGGGGNGLSMSDLCSLLRDEYARRGVLGPAATQAEMMRTAGAAVLSEILSTRSRISLEGVGLVRWDIKRPSWVRSPAAFTDPPWNLSQEQAWHLASLLFDTACADGAVRWPDDPRNPITWSDIDTEVRPHWYTSGAPRSRGSQRSWAGRSTRRARFLARVYGKLRDMPPDVAQAEAEAALNRLWADAREDDSAARKDNFFVLGSEGVGLNLAWWRFYPVEKSDTVYVCDTCGQVSAVDTFGVCVRPRCWGTTKAMRLENLPEDHYRTLYQFEFPGEFRAEEHTAQLAAKKAQEYQKDFKDGRIHLLSSSTTFELGVDLGDLDTVFLRNVPPQPFNYVQRVGRAGRRPGQPGIAITYCRRSPHDLYHFARPGRILSGRLERPPITSIKNAKVILRHMAAYCLHVFFKQDASRFEPVKALVGDFEHPSVVEAVRSLVAGRRAEIEAALKRIVPEPAWENVGLTGADADWLDLICGPESNLERAERVVCAEWARLEKFMKTSADARKFGEAEWARQRQETLETEDVLSFLSRSCVIPKYGFPVDVVPLETASCDEGPRGSGRFGRTSRAGGTRLWRGRRPACSAADYGIALYRSLSIAIGEYAPGSKVVANKKEWTSSGIKAVTGLTWPARSYRCSERHNFFQVWDRAEPEPGPPDIGLGVVTRTYVVPVFGFVTGRQPPQEPRRRPARQYTTRPYFANALGPDTGTVTMPSPEKPLILLKKAFPGRMVELCEGRRKAQFWVCPVCGAGVPGGKTYPGSHLDPYGQQCGGVLERVSLGHEFETDVVEARFLMPVWRAGGSAASVGGVEQAAEGAPAGVETGAWSHGCGEALGAVWFSYSLAYALLSGVTDQLGVPPEDLNVTVKHSDGDPADVQPILVYDNVPAGAGLVSCLEDPEFMEACLGSAFERVSGECGCGEDTSCYGCLRSYRNQFAHERLQRGPAKRYIEALLGEWGQSLLPQARQTHQRLHFTLQLVGG